MVSCLVLICHNFHHIEKLSILVKFVIFNIFLDPIQSFTVLALHLMVYWLTLGGLMPSSKLSQNVAYKGTNRFYVLFERIQAFLTRVRNLKGGCICRVLKSLRRLRTRVGFRARTIFIKKIPPIGLKPWNSQNFRPCPTRVL